MFMRCALFVFVLIFFAGFTSAALGITPAKQEVDFLPGKVYEFTFTIISDSSDKIIDLYLDGDLSAYGSLSTTQIVGSESFLVTITLPDEMSPGPHNIFVRGIEAVSENDFIGTRIDIGAPIRIFAPYPGRYADMQLSIANGNVDEQIPIELLVSNKGQENLYLEPYIDFYSNGKKIDTLSYKPAEVLASEERYFRKYLSTAGYKPGDYVGIATIDYGEISTINQSFRIGSLNVNVTNFTQRLQRGGIQRFHLSVESLWNHDILGLYADVNLSKDSEIVSFRTPVIDLTAWSTGQLEGFVDTSSLEGVYDIDISVYYSQKVTNVEGLLTIYSYNYTLLLTVMIIVLVGIILFFYLRNGRKK